MSSRTTCLKIILNKLYIESTLLAIVCSVLEYTNEQDAMVPPSKKLDDMDQIIINVMNLTKGEIQDVEEELLWSATSVPYRRHLHQDMKHE